MRQSPAVRTAGTFPKSGPFPPRALPRFHSTTNLSDSPSGPACPSRASGWVAPTARGLPCCVRSPCADMPSPLPRWDRGRDRLAPLLVSHGCGLPRWLAGSAPTLAFSRPAQRSLTLRPACSRDRLAVLSIEGFGDFVTSTAAPIATGWSESCRVGIAPTEDRRLFTAHQPILQPI